MLKREGSVGIRYGSAMRQRLKVRLTICFACMEPVLGRVEIERVSTSTGEKFHRAALKSLSDAGWARIHILKLRGQSIAASVRVFVGTRAFFYQSGIDPAYGDSALASC